jgi:aerobic C4-dicarboxylate transport protein
LPSKQDGISQAKSRSWLGPLWLQVLVAIVLGVAVGVVWPHTAAEMKPLGDAFIKLIRMALAPIIFGTVVVGTIGQYGLASLASLAQLTAEVWLVSVVFALLVLGLIARAAGFSILKFLQYIREEILITFGTSSSEAVLAPLMTKMERLGCPKPIVGMVMPAGYTFNADGTSIYLSMGAIFIAQAPTPRSACATRR